MTDNLSLCSKAREILTFMGPLIHKSVAATNKIQAAQAVSNEYLKKVLDINQ